jgi:hypothetical protein
MSRKKHAEIHGSPGARVRIVGLLRTQWPLLAVFGIAGYLLRAAIPHPPISKTLDGMLFLALAAGLATAASHSRKRLQSFLKGAKGEEIVAHELSFLPDSFTIFHDLDIKLSRAEGGHSANIDHIVVGPTGIFAIETKNWADSVTIANGELLYNGQKPSRPPLKQAKNSASTLCNFIKARIEQNIPVQPILCFASDSLTTGEQGSVGVLICNTEHLTNLIQSEDEFNLTKEKQQAVINALMKVCED